MIALLRVYEAMGLIFWELETSDPDFDGKLVRVNKGSFEGAGLNELERTRYALKQAWQYAGTQPKNQRGQLPR